MTKLVNLSLASLALCILLAGIVSAKSECEERKAKMEKTLEDQKRAGGGAMPILVPQCNSDGTYAQLQCFSGSEFCQCWDKEGSPISAPKKAIKKCSCLTDRAKQLKSIPASQQGEAIMTSCENDGTYAKKQCDRSSCWCADPDTGAKQGKESKDKSSVRC